MFRLLVICLGAISSVIMLFGLIWPVAALLQSLAALALALFFIVGSFHLFTTYLFAHPEFMISVKERQADPLLAADFSLIEALKRWRQNGSLEALWQNVYHHPEVAVILYRLGIRASDLPAVMPNLTLEEVEKWLAEAVGSLSRERPCLTLFDFLDWISRRQDFIALAQKLALSPEEIALLVDFYRSISARQSLSNQLGHSGGFARNWSVAYTNLLDRFTEELTVRNTRYFALSPLFSRETLLKEMAAASSKRSGQNILLVGEDGVGRTELFFRLASRIIRSQTKTRLDRAQVRLLNLSALLDAYPNHEQLALMMSRLFQELVLAGNVVLFIDRIDLLFDSGGKLGTVDLREIFGQYLSNEQIHLIGALTEEQYLRLVKPNSSLREAFSPLSVPPLEGAELEKALLLHLPDIEGRYGVFFLFGAVQAAHQLASRFLKDSASPKRELNILEEAAASSTEQKAIGAQEIAAVVEKKANVPIKYQTNERETLLNLEQLLHQRIVGQDEAIREVSNALLRARAGLASQTKPIGTFLFLGPTGVGKTETAKTLAEVYFGSQASLIRLDMTEYAGADALEKLLGANAEQHPGQLALAIQEKPSSVLLLDEVEKSSPAIRNLLLELLDEGKVTTNFGKKLDFTNTIVIATSNAASDLIKQQVEKGTTIPSKMLIDHLINRRIFLPELINRFDGVVVYLPLSVDQVRQIVDIQLSKLTEQVKRDKNISLTFTPAVTEELARSGYDPVFGARALQRVITDRLGTKIAREIVEQSLSAGASLTIDTLV